MLFSLVLMRRRHLSLVAFIWFSANQLNSFIESFLDTVTCNKRCVVFRITCEVCFVHCKENMNNCYYDT